MGTPPKEEGLGDLYEGMELVPDTRRLALMNLLLHGIELVDTLSDSGKKLLWRRSAHRGDD